MNREELIKKYELAIKNDKKMMEEEPENMFWYNDYDFNAGILKRLKEEV